MTAEIINEGWQLQNLYVNLKYPFKDGVYEGKITFTNSKNDVVSFGIPPDKMEALMSIIADSVMDSAQQLGQRLLKSIQLLAPIKYPEALPDVRGNEVGF